MTDFRALCAELADSLEEWLSSNSIGGISLDDGTDAELIYRARAALAQPEPQGPTDEEILALSESHNISYNCIDGRVEYPCREGYDMREDVLSYSRAVLARWGRPAIKPVPVAERLPGPEDCLGRPFEETDAGYCWWWFPEREEWCFAEAVIWRAGSYRNWTPTSATHWLPHHALPMPQQEGANG